MDNAMRNILEAAREYGFFVDRGDPAAFDFTKPDFMLGGPWQDLDLSAIVPANAHAILIRLSIQFGQVGFGAYLARKGLVNRFVSSGMTGSVAGIYIHSDLVVACDEDRGISYRFQGPPGTYTSINFIVKGWWY